MDSFRFWKDDFQREVEEVLAERRRARERGEPVDAVSGGTTSGRLADLAAPSLGRSMDSVSLHSRLAKAEADVARAAQELGALKGELAAAQERIRRAEERCVRLERDAAAAAESAAARTADLERSEERVRRAEEESRDKERAWSAERSRSRETMRKFVARLWKRAAAERARGEVVLEGEKARLAETAKRIDALAEEAEGSRREAMAATALARQLDEALAAERSKRDAAEKDLMAQRASSEGSLREAGEKLRQVEENLRETEERAAKALACAEAVKRECAAEVRRLREEMKPQETPAPPPSPSPLVLSEEPLLAAPAALPEGPGPSPSAAAEILVAPRDPDRAAATAETAPPREPWQLNDEKRYVTWIMIGAVTAAAILASVLYF